MLSVKDKLPVDITLDLVILMLIYILPVAPVQSPDVIPVVKLQLHIVAVLVKVIVTLLTEGIANVPVLSTYKFIFLLLTKY